MGATSGGSTNPASGNPAPGSSASRNPIGIDIGGSGIKGAPVDLVAGKFAAERVRIVTPSPATPDAVAGVVNEVLEKLDAPGPVGLTLPAVVRDGVVLTASNIDHGWIGTDAAALFRRTTGRDVAVLNDADAAGIAEMRYGIGRDHKGVVVMVTLGTGIGSAVFVDGVLVPNTELGHLPLHGADAEDWAAESVRETDDLSWKQWAKRLTTYLEVLENILWPQLIIVGGGVSKKSEKFLPRIDLRTPLVAAELYNDAGIIGAALAAPNA